MDKNWLEALNGERSLSGLNTVTESEMEKTVEEMEKQCREKINSTLRNNGELARSWLRVTRGVDGQYLQMTWTWLRTTASSVTSADR